MVSDGRISGDCAKVKLKDGFLEITHPSARELSVNSIKVFPRSIDDEGYHFKIRILKNTKKTGFLLGFSLALYVMASKVDYVITSILVIFISSVLGLLSPSKALSSFSSSVVFVFLAGSAFEIAMRKTRLDNYLAGRISKNLKSPFFTSLSSLIVASLLSALMSNTAATYVMVPIIAALFESDPEWILITLVSATAVGGSLTIIGTPPNLIVSQFIKDVLGIEIGFREWLRFGFRVWIFGMIFILVFLIFKSRKIEVKRSQIDVEFDSGMLKALAVILFTVILWIFSGINSGIVALLSIALFLILKVLEREDFKKLRWDLVFLFAGGLTLGKAMIESGYVQYMVGKIPLPHDRFGIFSILTAILFLGTVFSSHTSASALIGPLMIPIGMAISSSFNADPKDFGMKMAILSVLSINSAMALPISTPPSAIVFSTGKVKLRNLFLYGIVFGIVMNTFLSFFLI